MSDGAQGEASCQTRHEQGTSQGVDSNISEGGERAASSHKVHAQGTSQGGDSSMSQGAERAASCQRGDEQGASQGGDSRMSEGAEGRQTENNTMSEKRERSAAGNRARQSQTNTPQLRTQIRRKLPVAERAGVLAAATQHTNQMSALLQVLRSTSALLVTGGQGGVAAPDRKASRSTQTIVCAMMEVC